MGNISDAMAGMRDLFLSVDPDPQDPLVGAWVFQDEQASIDLDILPFAIVSRLLVGQEVWRRNAHDSAQHDWFMEVLLMLKAGAILNDQKGAEAESLCDPWQRTIMAAIYADKTLSGTVLTVGEVGENIAFRAEIGQVDWLNKTFWGIRFVFPISQVVFY